MYKSVSVFILALAFFSQPALAFQDNSIQNRNQLSIDQVIQRFAAAESENKVARNNYTFTQDVDLMTIGAGDSITGRFHRVSDIVYDDRGNRFEKITYFPPSTLKAVTITQADMQDLAGVQPFALTAEDLPNYQVDYVGKEKIDELSTYVFDVKPKRFEKGERYFEGRIWVDDHDLQIVKAAGKGVPETEDSKFPRFETYRENIDERYWFPTYTYADDELAFKSGAVRLRMVVRYTKYKKFTTGIRLADEGEAASEEDVKSGEKDMDKDKPELNKEKRDEQANPVLKKPQRKPNE